MSITELQALLDASRARASSFTKSLSGAQPRADEVQGFVNRTRNITLAVVRQDGTPHAAPVIGGCLYGDIYATVSPGSILANCLRRNPQVAFTMADLVHTLIGAGSAEKRGRASELEALCDEMNRSSPYGRFVPEGWDGLIYQLHPHRLLAW